MVGAVLIYHEGDQCRWSLDWLYANCDRVCVVLDNWDEVTEKIVLEYKDRFPLRTHLAYCTDPVDMRKNHLAGYVKRRFKVRQGVIRQVVADELRKMHAEKPIDLLVWPDSDETFTKDFPKYLEEFWNNQPAHDYMMLGFVEVYDSFRILITQPMAPHGRVYKYKPELNVLPWKRRTSYNPYYNEKRPWKVRHLVVHLCHFTEKYRAFRKHVNHEEDNYLENRLLWFLPKDVREMTVAEIQEYQFGFRQAPPKYPPIKLVDYIKNKDYYLSKYNIKPWTKD